MQVMRMTPCHVKGSWARPARCRTQSFVYLHCGNERKPQSFSWTLTLIIKRRKKGTSKRTPGYAAVRRLGLGAADQTPLTPTSYGPSRTKNGQLQISPPPSSTLVTVASISGQLRRKDGVEKGGEELGRVDVCARRALTSQHWPRPAPPPEP